MIYTTTHTWCEGEGVLVLEKEPLYNVRHYTAWVLFVCLCSSVGAAQAVGAAGRGPARAGAVGRAGAAARRAGPLHGVPRAAHPARAALRACARRQRDHRVRVHPHRLQAQRQLFLLGEGSISQGTSTEGGLRRNERLVPSYIHLNVASPSIA